MPTELNGHYDQLLELIGEQDPVFVLGPGCHRVGYDQEEDPGWKEVQRRLWLLWSELDDQSRVFLEQLYISKLSDELRDMGEEQDLLRPLRKGPEENEATQPTDFDAWRTKLLSFVLRGLRAASCGLGVVVAEGRSPVTRWQDVSSMMGRRAEDEAAESSDAGTADAAQHFRQSLEMLSSAAHLALAMFNLDQGNTLSPAERVVILGLPKADDLPAAGRTVAGEFFKTTSHRVVVSKLVKDVGTMLSALVRHWDTDPLVGGHVEWLLDLLWYLIVSDTEVPPSQAELAVFVNIGEQDPFATEDLKRPSYGDRRVTAADLPDRVRLLMRMSDATRGQQDASLARDRLFRTVAKAIVAQHRVLQQDKKTSGRLTIALSSDYGDRLAREVVRYLQENERCHVVTPVWLGGRDDLGWVIGTAPPSRFGDNSEVQWRWLSDATKIAGPVVVKLNGSLFVPFQSERFEGTAHQFGLCEQDHEFADISLRHALLYEEHDTLSATLSFEALATTGGPVGAALLGVEGLNWDNRGWLLMGQRFSDWVPRLRLFSRRAAPNKANKRAPGVTAIKEPRHWAIDRVFDWPERGLLTSLQIDMVTGDLADAGSVTRKAVIVNPSKKLEGFMRVFNSMKDL